MDKNKNFIDLFFLVITLGIVFGIYSFSLNREWQFFDERGIYNEAIFPRPQTFSELIEIIKTYAFNYHLDSQNAFFSNIVTVRSNSLGAILQILFSFLFKKNAFYYHLLEISIHILNTGIVWFSINKLFHIQGSKGKTTLLLTTLITLIWSLHPTNIEAVLLGTNWTSLLTYSFCFIFILYTLEKIQNNKFKYSKTEMFFIPVLTFLSLSISEYGYTIPLILFFTVLAFRNSLFNAFNVSLPYLFGIFIYAFTLFIRSLLTSTNHVFNLFNFSPERLFWLSPQIFIYFFKLFFYPKELSVYQTNLLTLTDSLFHPYAVICFFIFLAFLILSACVIVLKKNSWILFLVYSFLFSLFPFLHIISPTYCLIAERYCYFPLFLFLFFIAASLPPRYNKTISPVIFIIPLLFLILAFASASINRINDWKNSYSFYLSAAKCNGNNLYKGEIYSVLGYYFNVIENNELKQRYIELSDGFLRRSVKELSLKIKEKSDIIKTSKIYGKDLKSELVTAAFALATSRLEYLNENAKEVLAFYEPIIENNLDFAGNSQLNLYAKLLIKTKQPEKALKVLEFAREKYPLSPIIINSLSKLYLSRNDVLSAEQIIKEGIAYFPSYNNIILRAIKLYELKNEPENQAKFTYLLGLRTHSLASYQKAAQLYLSINKTDKAKPILNKLLSVDKHDPVTYLLLSKYHNLRKNYNESLSALNQAYFASKSQGDRISPVVYKSVILSLISFNVAYGNPVEVKKYIGELEKYPKLLPEEKASLENLKKKLNLE